MCKFLHANICVFVQKNAHLTNGESIQSAVNKALSKTDGVGMAFA